MTIFRPITAFLSDPAPQWAPGAHDNGFLLIVGGSGSGKTTAIRKIMAGLDGAGMPSLNIDFHGDMMQGRRCESVLLSGGAASTIGLNPLDLDPAAVARSGLREQVHDLRDVIASRIKSIGHNQSPLLAGYLEEAYAQAGIIEGDPKSWERPAPALADVLRIMADSEDKEARGLINMLKDTFGHAIFAKPQYLAAPALIARTLHIDMSAIGSDVVKGIAVDTILRSTLRALRARGHIADAKTHREKFRTFLVVDEARHAGTATMETIFREARKFGLGAILAAQCIEDFAAAVRAQAASWMLLRHQSTAEATRTAKELGLEPAQLTGLRGKGHGLFRQGNMPWQTIGG